MDGTIFYFTGTGNSLAAAEEIATRTDIEQLIPIAGEMKKESSVCGTEVAGFVFPLYFWGMPELVERFLNKVDLSACNYIFAVVTRGGSRGKVFDDLKKILSQKGKKLNAGFYLTMPGNYIPMYGVGTEEKVNDKLKKASGKLQDISRIINEKKDQEITEGVFLKAMASIIHSRWKQKVARKDILFSLNKERCISCGLCSQVCPVDNIKMINGRPIWQHHCQECMACIHACPVEAIQMGSKTADRPRYHHPDVTWEEIADQKRPRE
jgi:ferredoxin